MQDLPSELHQYLAQFLDASTLLLFPRVCKSIEYSLGWQPFSLERAVQAAAADDNLELLVYFLHDKTSKREKDFYRMHVLSPTLKASSWCVLNWYLGKKYKLSFETLLRSLETINMEMLDLLMTREEWVYADLAHRAIEFDRADILYKANGPIVPESQLPSILYHDAINCFCLYLQNRALPANFKQLVLAKGGEKIINRLLCKRKEGQRKILTEADLHVLFQNKQYNYIPFFEYCAAQRPFTAEEICMILKYKNKAVIMHVMHGVTVTKEHCLAILEQDWTLKSELVREIFPRFQGQLEVNQQLDLGYNGHLALEIVAEKLVSLRCLTNAILYAKHHQLYQRLLDERGIQEEDLEIILYHYSREMLELYLQHATIPTKKHLHCYTRLGEQFVELMTARGYVLSKQVAKRREERENKKRKREEQKEEAKKRQKL